MECKYWCVCSTWRRIPSFENQFRNYRKLQFIWWTSSFCILFMSTQIQTSKTIEITFELLFNCCFSLWWCKNNGHAENMMPTHGQWIRFTHVLDLVHLFIFTLFQHPSKIASPIRFKQINFENDHKRKKLKWK